MELEWQSSCQTQGTKFLCTVEKVSWTSSLYRDFLLLDISSHLLRLSRSPACHSATSSPTVIHTLVKFKNHAQL